MRCVVSAGVVRQLLKFYYEGQYGIRIALFYELFLDRVPKNITAYRVGFYDILRNAFLRNIVKLLVRRS